MEEWLARQPEPAAAEREMLTFQRLAILHEEIAARQTALHAHHDALVAPAADLPRTTL